jgi:hypothetical protein
MKEVVTKVKSFNKPDPKSAFVRGCYLETLVRKPVSEATSGLVELLRPEEDMEVRHQAARAIAAGGVSASVASVLQGKLSDPSLRADAVLALLLGADADTASRAVLSYNDGKPEELEELKTIYNQTFGYWSDVNFEKGDVARWIENAQAVSRVRVFSALQDWPRLILARGLQGIDFDNGPHSMTRVQFRVRLVNAAKGADAVKRDQAIEILKFMREKGVLMALRNEPGVLGDLAKKAYFEVMNPKATVEQIPEAKKADLSSVSGAGSKAR